MLDQAYLGVDTGGTFTDFVLLQNQTIRSYKCPSTPEHPELAILHGIREMGLQDLVDQGRLLVVHGSTVATNAALEGKGVRTAFITNRGFGDIEVARVDIAGYGAADFSCLGDRAIELDVTAGALNETAAAEVVKTFAGAWTRYLAGKGIDVGSGRGE